MNGAEAMVQCLLEEGVNTIFGIPGVAIAPFYEAMYENQDKITHIESPVNPVSVSLRPAQGRQT